MIRKALVIRQFTLWILLRITHAGFAAAMPFLGPAAAIELFQRPQAADAIVAVVLGLVEVRRRRERVLLGNLGVSRNELAAIWIIPTIIAESVVGIVNAAL